MAKTAQKHSFESIIRDIDAKKTAPVYLLMGAEPYYIDRISDHIANHVLAKEEQDFNQMVVYAADTTPVQIVEMAKRYPMMAEKQVVIVKEAQNIKAWEPIEKYLENPLPSTVLVICYKNGKIDGRKKIVSDLEGFHTIIIICIYSQEGMSFQLILAAEKGVCGSPGFFPSLRDLNSFRKLTQFLENIADLHFLCYAVADLQLEFLFKGFPDDKYYLAETAAICIIDCIIHKGMAHLIYRCHLLQATETTSHSCRHHN